MILERTKRILVPLVFGVLTIVPLHIFLWQQYYRQDINYMFNLGHLWFLANIFVYVLLLSPVFFYFKKNENSVIIYRLKKLLSTPFGLFLVITPFVLEAVLVDPEAFEMYAMTLHGFVIGLLAFLFGFWFVISGDAFWKTVLKWRWLFLLIAAVLYLLRLIIFELQTPNYLLAIESCNWIFTIFGFAYKYLNHPSKALSYLSQAAYPVYIIHMVFLYLASLFIFPLEIPAIFKFILIVAFTGIGCFAFYEFVIRRIRILRPLFGIKTK